MPHRQIEHLYALADNINQLAWIADGSGWIYWYNKRWYEFTGTTLEEMAGWGWKKVHHPDHVDRVVAHIARCFETGEPWEDTFPLRGADGSYRWFLSRAMPIREDGEVTCWYGTNTDITEQREAERRINESEERFRALANSMPQLVWTATPDGWADYFNSRRSEYDGIQLLDGAGWNWTDAIHAEDMQASVDAWAAARQEGTDFAFTHRLRMADGSYRWHLSRATFVGRGSAGAHWYGTATDIHDLKQVQEQRQILVEELNHRVKNTLALVQSIATQTFRDANLPPEAMASFTARLKSLAEAHQILTRENWGAVSMHELARATLQSCGIPADRVRIDGGPVMLPARSGVMVGMALHELTTNACKYGALANDTGQVQLSWQKTAGANQFHLCWKECGGPPVSAPAHEGFGSKLIKRALAAELNGTVDVDYAAAGLTYRIVGTLQE